MPSSVKTGKRFDRLGTVEITRFRGISVIYIHANTQRFVHACAVWRGRGNGKFMYARGKGKTETRA